MKVFSGSYQQDEKLHRSNVSEEQKKQEIDFTTGKIEESTINQFIEEQKERFAELGINKINLTQLVKHPVTIETKKRYNIKAEDYFLLDPIIQAFTDLVSLRADQSAGGIRLLGLKEF